MNKKIEEIANKLVNTEIELNAKLTLKVNGKETKIEIPIENCNIVGDTLEDIFYNIAKKEIPKLKKGPKQNPPDFFVKKDDKTYNYELKSFKGSPGFDISNYTSFLSQICLDNETFKRKINTKYIVYKYTFEDNKIKILKCYFLPIWKLIGYNEKYAITIQTKKGMWYNIRPQGEKKWTEDDKTCFTFLKKVLCSIDLCTNKLEFKNDYKNFLKDKIAELEQIK